MLPNKTEQNRKYQEIVSELGKFLTYDKIALEYAKWYATEVIKHCSEVADVEFNTSNGGCCSTDKVDKQSILNVITQLT